MTALGETMTDDHREESSTKGGMMTAARVDAMTQCEYWPSPAHASAMMLIAASTYRDEDPQAPPDLRGWIRVRVSQGDIADKVNVTPKTVRKVFADFAEMNVLRRAEGSRTWYLNPNIDHVYGFSMRMLEWRRLNERRRAEPSADVGVLDEWTAPAAAPAPEAAAASTNGHTPHRERPMPPPLTWSIDRISTWSIAPIRELLEAENRVNPELRLTTAIGQATESRGVMKSYSLDWRRQYWPTDDDLIAYFLEDEDGKLWQSIDQWVEANIDGIRALVPQLGT